MFARILLILLGLLGLLGLTPLALAEQAVRCESPNFRYQHCRADVRGDVRLVRQLSQAPCIRGQTWDVTRDGIWVDRGCAAEFEVASGAGADRPPWIGGERPPWVGGDDGGGDRLICESQGFRYNLCRADIRGGVRLHRQLSERTCRRGENWGVTREGVWVDGGCAAEFAVGRNLKPQHDGDSRRVVCRSRALRREFCRADVSNGVSLARQLSRRTCTYGQSWGVERGGIWVDHGCSAEFVLERRGGFTSYEQAPYGH